MSLEELPIELIYEIFEYLNAIDIFRAFYGSNHRFDQYLILYPAYRLDFRQIAKNEFIDFSQQHLPLIQSQIISLNVSDDDNTPNASTLLISNYLHFDRCQHLQCLILQSIESSSILIRILEARFPLKKLSLVQCQLSPDQKQILNHIWNMSSLRSCTLDGLNLPRQSFAQISTTSHSLIDLLIKDVSCNFQDIVVLFEHTPHLHRLEISLICEDKFEQISLFPLRHLTTLSLSFTGPSLALQFLFQRLSQLKSLRLHTSTTVFNGHQWERFICDYVPHLRDFGLVMDVRLKPDEKQPKILDKFLSTFQTNFWLIDHQWFVRLDWNPLVYQSAAFLYTLPYAFEKFRFFNNFQYKSTSNDHNVFEVYDRVTHLQCNDGLPDDADHCTSRFMKINRLEMVLPCSRSSLSVIPSENQLRSIDVAIFDRDISYQQLQMILDRSPYLEILRFSDLLEWDPCLFELKSSSIRRLDLFSTDSMIYSWYLSNEHCDLLAKSSLGQQCRTLVISLQERRSILELIIRMPMLQSLTVRCQDDTSHRFMTSETKTDTFLRWLQEYLPSKSICSRRTDHPSIIHIWIR